MSLHHPIRSRIAVLLVAATAIAATTTTGPAQAFAPRNWKSLGSASHQSMTETVVKALAGDYFSLPKQTKSMIKAMDQIVDANAATDDDQTHSALHFDGENFDGGQQRLVTLADRTVTSIKAEDTTAAREALGGALHTLQDFYAHTNWVELGNTAPNPQLGTSASLGNVAGPTEATCNGSTLITTKLTSGYYSGEDRAPAVTTKCRHGGPFDHSAGSGGINKDLTTTFFSPHSSFHAAAAGQAQRATRMYIDQIKARLTDRELRLLFGVGPTLGMSIDTTGSMGSIIDGVRNQAIQIVDDRIGTDEEPSKYVLAPFNDPGVGAAQVTTDPDQFKAGISGLGADGGDDCPELSMTGALRAVTAMDEGSDLFLFTDADSKDAGLEGTVSALASSKDIRIFPMIFGSCSDEKAGPSSGSHSRLGQQPPARRPAGAPADKAAASFVPQSVYLRLAAATGGQMFALDTSDAGSITKLADELVRANSVNLAIVDGTLTGPVEHTVPVDSTVKRLTVSVSAPSASGFRAVLHRPDGTAVGPGDPGVSVVTPSAASGSATIITVTAPVAGIWRVALDGSGDYVLTVDGEATLDLSSAEFVTPDAVDPDPAREGGHPLPGAPVAGQTVGLDAVLTEGFATADFTARAPDGTVLETWKLSRQDDEFAGVVTLPRASFRIYAAGTDAAGRAYQRVLPGIVSPRTLEVTAPPAAELPAAATTSLTFHVKNSGPAGTFAIGAADEHSWVVGVKPAELALGSGETKDVTVDVAVPADLGGAVSDTVTLTATSTTDPATANFAIVTNTLSATSCVSGTVKRAFSVDSDQRDGDGKISSPKFKTKKTGELLLAYVSANGPTTGPQSVTAVTGGGLTWTLVQRDNTARGTSEIWQAYAAEKLSSTRVVAALAVKGYTVTMTVAGFTKARSTVGSAAHQSGTASAPEVSLTPQASGSVIWAVGRVIGSRYDAKPVSGQKVVHDKTFKSPRTGYWIQRIKKPTTSTTKVTVGDKTTAKAWGYTAVEIRGTCG